MDQAKLRELKADVTATLSYCDKFNVLYAEVNSLHAQMRDAIDDVPKLASLTARRDGVLAELDMLVPKLGA